MSSSPVFVAGATGALGRRVVVRLLERGRRVRVLARDPARLGAIGASVEVHLGDALHDPKLAEAMAGCGAVFSALGASVSADFAAGREGFLQVDTPANLRLLDAARAAGVPRFVYTSLLVTPRAAGTAYVVAHERVVDALRTSGLDWCVLRPTGFYSAFLPMLELAQRGRVPIFGDGAARTNPIADDDLAELAMGPLLAAAPIAERELPCGGPDVLSRRRIAELVCEAAGRGRVLSLPAAVGRMMAFLVKPFSPRMSDFVRFVLAVGAEDCVAPVRGQRRLADAFAEALAQRRGARSLSAAAG